MADDYSKILDDRKYEYLAPLGAGSFGVIIKARHIPLDVPVAMKILQVVAAKNADAVDRFRIEAQGMARLSGHPNVCEVLDYGMTEDGRPFFSMRFLAGRSLAAEIQERGTLPPHEAIQVTFQVLSALEAAHNLALVHRDVKPANIFLVKTADGALSVKLLDFGIAKIVQGDGTIKPRAQDTAEGTLMGSPPYFAPEQAKGTMGMIDPRTDVYSVGAVLFRLLTGSTLFPQLPGQDEHQNLLALMRAHVSQAPPHLTDRSEVPFPAALDAAIQKALAKDPADRHQSAAAFAAELRAIPGAALLTLSKPRQGTEPIETQRMMQEVSRRQLEKEAVVKKRTVRIKDQAQAQELDRLRRESGWRAGHAPLPAKGSTVPMGPQSSTQIATADDETTTLAMAPRRRGFTRREAIVVAILCGLAFAACVIALLRHYGP